MSPELKLYIRVFQEGCHLIPEQTRSLFYVWVIEQIDQIIKIRCRRETMNSNQLCSAYKLSLCCILLVAQGRVEICTNIQNTSNT